MGQSWGLLTQGVITKGQHEGDPTNNRKALDLDYRGKREKGRIFKKQDIITDQQSGSPKINYRYLEQSKFFRTNEKRERTKIKYLWNF